MDENADLGARDTGEQWDAHTHSPQWGRGAGRVQPAFLGAEQGSPSAGTCTRRDQHQLTVISVHNCINLPIN